MTGHVAVAHIGKKACDGGVGLAGVVGDLPVIPLLPGFAQGFLDLWNVLLRQTGGPAVHATGKVSTSHNIQQVTIMIIVTIIKTSTI